MRRFEDHDCLLTNVQDDVITNFIDSGCFIKLRRDICSLCMINRKHPETSRFFKSYSACRFEEIRQLGHHRIMIHPFSRFNLYWEFYMFLLFTAHYVAIPIHMSVLRITVDHPIYIGKLILDLMHIADMIKLFFTGYYNFDKSKVVFNSTEIAKKYLLTYFIFDVTSCTHSFLFPARKFVDISAKVGLFLRLFSLLKIVRIFRWLKIMELSRQYLGYSNYLYKGLQVVLIFCVLIFWAFSIHFFIDIYLVRYVKHMTQSEWGKEILENFLDATTTLMMVSAGNYDMQEIPEYINAFFFVCFGFALQLFVYAQVIQVWTKYSRVDNKRYSLHQQFEEYMKFRELPLRLRGRFMSYFEFRFHKHFFKESDLNNMISPFIRQEILMHVTRSHVEKVAFFKHLPENVLMKVVAQLKTEIFLPGDVIISAGTTGNSMFFINHGTVAVFTPSGKEICHLEDGAHFGEIALILSETRVASVVAVTTSELFTLKRSDFLVAIEQYPESKDQLLALATERLHTAIAQTSPDHRSTITSFIIAAASV